MTGQTLLLQYHLNGVFDPEKRRILIRHAIELALFIPLSIEAYPGVDFSLKDEDRAVYISLLTDRGEQLETDFFLLIPEDLNEIALAAVVNKYKIAGKTFKIIIQENYKQLL